MRQSQNRTRIAPSPSGFLHLGNVLSFAITSALAQSTNSLITLRIDDIDQARCKSEFVDDIFETIEWLDIKYQFGPKNTADFFKHYSQWLRSGNYHTQISKLSKSGFLYACNCSRSQIFRRSKDGIYPRTCLHKNIPLDTPGVGWRIKIPEDTTITFNDLLLGETSFPLGQRMPDFIIRRKDGFPSYQISSLIDDATMECNLIVRGQDLIPSTAAQLYLSQLLGINSFQKNLFAHHLLLYDDNGAKLSKSNQSLSICQLKNSGIGPTKIWTMLSKTLWPNKDPVCDLESFCRCYQTLHLDK